MDNARVDAIIVSRQYTREHALASVMPCSGQIYSLKWVISILTAIFDTYASWIISGGRKMIDAYIELQEIGEHIAEVASGWGPFSQAVGGGFFQRSGAAVEDSRAQTTITQVAPQTWFIRMPFANMCVLETDDGIVLVDTGGACHGPALLEAIRSVTDKPFHTAIYTHAHVDHAYGLWAFKEAGELPQNIIAHENTIDWFKRYPRLRGLYSRHYQQQLKDWPDCEADFIWPTQTYKDTLELQIGGETFLLRHHRGETDDATWVWVPERKVLCTGDFYIQMLPNVGNPRRIQRHPEEWAEAVEEMSALNAEILLPGHGDVIYGSQEIRRALLDVAEVLRYVVDHTIAGLNDQKLREDQVFQSIKLPEHMANNPKLQPHHATAKDISRMVINQYTGWWDDRPSHIDPAPVEVQALEIANLAGGVEALAARAQELADTDLQLAGHMAEWAFYADPSNSRAQDAMIEVFLKRARATEQTIHLGIYILEAIIPALEARQAGTHD